MFEKRRHPRRPVRLPIFLLTQDGQRLPAESVDLSVGGMFINGSQALTFSQEIEIELELPEIGTSRIPAIVRWARPDGIGVQFGLIGVHQTRAINAIVAEAPEE